MSAKTGSHSLAFVVVTISVLLLVFSYTTNAKGQPMAPTTPSAPPVAAKVVAPPPMAPAPAAMLAVSAPRPFDPAPMTAAVKVSEPTMEAMATPAMAEPPMVVAPRVAATPSIDPLEAEFKTRKPVAEEAGKPPVAAKPELVVQPVTSTVSATPVATVSPTVSTAEKKDNWWQTLLGGLLQLVLLFAASILTPLGVLLVKYVAKKAKIADAQVQEALNGLYDCAVDTGITFATQMANKLNNNPDAKAQRIKWATSKALELVTEWKLPEKTSKWIEDAIEARLGWANGTKPVEEEVTVSAVASPEKPAEKAEATPISIGVSTVPLDLSKKE
jgi:hypothetical protein